ncbi:MAG TPA: hypothetical protein DCZ94_08355 [Lentisphaeria bacterium]|nr:MAG: hypothetical protein A2X48_19835 [Lentisphaerae bacterium GWF2_49_21]HBC86949.1 hypothetical protein [Lentisphaeria bacterium]
MELGRIKFGAHIFLWTERWSSEEIRLISRAKKLGLDVLEIAVGDDVEFDAERIKRCAADNEIEIVISPGGIWPMEADISSSDPKNRKVGLEWHKQWIEKGAQAGATAYTGALYSHPGHIDRRKITEDELKYTAINLQFLAEFAAKRNMKIVLEPMSHFRVSLVNTPSQLTELIKRTESKNLYALMDTYHLVTEIRDYAEAVKTLSPWLWGIHACENDRGVPGGGIMPWDKIFSALKKNKFDGYFILETYNSSIRKGDFASSRGMFHDVCPDGDEFVKQGINFIKGNF